MKVSKNISSFFNNSLKYFFFNVINKLIPFLLLPIIIRLVSVSDYGSFSYFLTIEAMLIPIITLNLSTALYRDYFNNEINISKYLSTMFISYFIFAFILLSILFFIPTCFYEKVGFERRIFVIVILTTSGIGIFQSIESLFRLQKKPSHYGRYIIVQSFFYFFLLITLAYYGRSFISLIKARMIFVFCYILLSLFVLKKLKIITLYFDFSLFKRMIYFSLPTVFYSISVFLFTFSDRFFIEHYLGRESLGHYSAIYQLSSVINILSVAINAAWMPWLFENLKKNDSSIKLTIVKLSYFLCISIIIIGVIYVLIFPYISNFILTQEYYAYIGIAYLIIIGFICQAMYFIISPYIFYVGKTKYNAFIGSLVGISAIGLNIFFIPKFGIIGAAYTFCIVWTLQLIGFSIFSYKSFSMPWFFFIKSKKIN